MDIKKFYDTDHLPFALFKQGENEMAEVDTQMLSNQHSDIRFEQQAQAHALALQSGQETNEIVKEGLKATAVTDGAIKDSRYELSSRIENAADRADRGFSALDDRFFTVARDTADLRAQVIQAIDTTKLATELASLKGIIEGQRNTTYLSDKISADGERTRGLINDLKYHDLSRGIIERTTEIVELRNDRDGWRHRADQGQWAGQFAALQSQIQNFNSQLAETRQGMVNFGTMAGNAGQQTASTNNVR